MALRRSARIRNKTNKNVSSLRRSTRLRSNEGYTAKSKPASRVEREMSHSGTSDIWTNATKFKTRAGRGLRKQLMQGLSKVQQKKGKRQSSKTILENVADKGLKEKICLTRKTKTKGKTAKAQRRTCPSITKQSALAKAENADTYRHSVPSWKHSITFGNNNTIRYVDVAFLDNNHILAVDDTSDVPSGNQVYCFLLDGTMVASLPLPGEPWTVVTLSPAKAVVTLRGTDFRGLIWLSINVNRGIIECTKKFQMEKDAHGISYNKDKDLFVVSHGQEDFLTIVNKENVCVDKIPITKGTTYRCLFSRENIIYLDYLKSQVKAIDYFGRETVDFPTDKTSSPVDIDQDVKGNIYVAYYNKNVCQYDAGGNYVATLFDIPLVCGIGLNTRADLMAVAHTHSISIYHLENPANPALKQNINNHDPTDWGVVHGNRHSPSPAPHAPIISTPVSYFNSLPISPLSLSCSFSLLPNPSPHFSSHLSPPSYQYPFSRWQHLLS